jgi:hypothetical protein
MSMTRGALLTLVEEMADAVNAPRWGATLKRQLLGEVHWREWKDLLNINRHLRMGARTVTTDADGRFLKTALNSGAGDATETHYRILSVNAGNFFYQPATYEQYPQSPTEVSLPQVWYERGEQIQLIPATTGSEVTVMVNHLPQRADLLASDTSPVVFPDGYDLLLAYETAASMYMKGGAETNVAVELRQMAMVLRERMHQDVGRITVRPMRMAAMDDRWDWGAV